MTIRIGVIRLGVTGAELGAKVVTVRGPREPGYVGGVRGQHLPGSWGTGYADPCRWAGSEHGQRGIGCLLERLVHGQYPVRCGQDLHTPRPVET